MAAYADLDFTLALMATNQVTDTDLREGVLRALRTVSRRADGFYPLRGRVKRPYFEPYLEQRAYAVRRIDVNSLVNTLTFDDPLFELTAITSGSIDNQQALTPVTDVTLYPPLQTPSHKLRLLTRNISWYDHCGGSLAYNPPFVYLTGFWGMHRDYAQAWQPVDTLAAPITSTTATTFTVADVDGEDEQGFIPRFSPGMLIKIDTEYMEVIDVVVATNTVHVHRGQNGTTAATHLVAASVSVWRIEDPLRRAVARQAAMIYARRGAYSTIEVTAAGSEIRYPPDLLVEFRAEIDQFSYGN